MNIKRFVLINVAPANETKRIAWVKKQLSKIPPNKKIIDVGAGEMPYKPYCSHLKYTSQDLGKYSGKSEIGIKSGKYNTKSVDIISDIMNIPVRDKSFDYVLCTEVFEHIPDPLGALKELSRINKTGLIISAPFASLTHFYPFFFNTGFSEQFYRVNLPKFGYKIKKTYSYGNYFDLLGMELLRLPLIILKYSKFFTIIVICLLPLTFPLVISLRLASKLFPQSKDIYCFGVCVYAEKI